jgi:hypothetical protein
MNTCLYCGCNEGDEIRVPAVDDDEGWDMQAQIHATYCEWVATRAHRIEEEQQ